MLTLNLTDVKLGHVNSGKVINIICLKADYTAVSQVRIWHIIIAQ